jgi:hypothetical protein
VRTEVLFAGKAISYMPSKRVGEAFQNADWLPSPKRRKNIHLNISPTTPAGVGGAYLRVVRLKWRVNIRLNISIECVNTQRGGG